VCVYPSPCRHMKGVLLCTVINVDKWLNPSTSLETFQNACILDHLASGQSGTGMKKGDAGTCLYQNKGTPW
jgi:hypothetical protein